MQNRFLHALRACLISTTAAIVLAACGGGGGESDFSLEGESPARAPAKPRELPFERVTGDFNGGAWPVQSYTARTQEEWTQLWATYARFGRLGAAKPVVDFKARTVAGVSLGWSPNSCHSVEITRVTDEPERIRVEYRHVNALSTATCIPAAGPLVAFVKFPATSKEIVIEQEGRVSPPPAADSATFSFDGPASGSLPSAFVQAKQAWLASKIADYRFDVKRLCYCMPWNTPPVTVTVQGGRMIAAGYAPLPASPAARPTPDQYIPPSVILSTMPIIFDSAADALTGHAERVQFIAGAPSGVVLGFNIDYYLRMADEELGFAITNFKQLPPLAPPPPTRPGP